MQAITLETLPVMWEFVERTIKQLLFKRDDEFVYV